MERYQLLITEITAQNTVNLNWESISYFKSILLVGHRSTILSFYLSLIFSPLFILSWLKNKSGSVAQAGLQFHSSCISPASGLSHCDLFIVLISYILNKCFLLSSFPCGFLFYLFIFLLPFLLVPSKIKYTSHQFVNTYRYIQIHVNMYLTKPTVETLQTIHFYIFVVCTI